MEIKQILCIQISGGTAGGRVLSDGTDLRRLFVILSIQFYSLAQLQCHSQIQQHKH